LCGREYLRSQLIRNVVRRPYKDLSTPFFPKEQFEFPTGLPREAARARLAASIKQPTVAGYLHTRVGGYVDKHGAVLVVRRFWVRNSFRPVLDGRWVEGQTGASLVGEFRVGYFVPAFLVVTVPLLLFTGLAAATPRPGSWETWRPVLLQRIGWAIAFVAITFVGAWLSWATHGGPDKQLIRDHLKTTFALR
jgi:hypothetical protein